MSIVLLTSGGLDSTLMTVLARESGITIHPLFIDYGQISRKKELTACRAVFKKLELPQPEILDVAGFGKFFPSGITNSKKHILDDAFLPGRNFLFLLLGAAYAYNVNADAVAIGLLNEETSIFPDQTKTFIRKAEDAMTQALGRKITVLTPLMSFSKTDVISLAETKGIRGTYSCHAGLDKPCGICIACREFLTKEA